MSRPGTAMDTRTRVIPSAYSVVRRDNIAQDFLFRNRELVDTVVGGFSNFTMVGLSANVPGYDMNAGSTTTFPWLSRIASCYEKFRFESLTFEVVPRNSTNYPGTMYLAFDYDYDDPVAQSATEMMINRGSSSGDLWSPKKLVVDCKRANEGLPWRFVSAKVGNESNRLVYGGFFMLALAGMTASGGFDIYAEYTVRLTLPALHYLQTSDTQVGGKTLPAGAYTALNKLPSLGGLISQFACGLGTQPVRAFADGVGYVIPPSLKGVLDMTCKLATAGSTPASFATDTKFDAALYDSDGNSLNDSIASTISDAAVYPSPNILGEWSTLGALSTTNWSLDFASLRKAFPKACYLVPYILSAAGRVLAASTTIYGKYKEL